MPKFEATAYLRLSYTENHENESDSIANQKKLIEDYVKAIQTSSWYPRRWTMGTAVSCLTVLRFRR